MVRRHDEVRDRVAAAGLQASERSDRLARLNGLANGTFSHEQQQIEAEIRQAKRELERAGAEVARLRQEESDLAAAVAQAQARWVEINSALKLDRALGPTR